MSDFFATLDGTLDEVWQRLARGVADRDAPARHPVLATVGATGGEARIVILRSADRAAGRLTVHTDLASEKVAELRSNPAATLLVWEASVRFQIRLRVRAEVAKGDAALWEAVPEASRAVYGGVPMPGESLADPAAFEPFPTRDRFGVIDCTVREIETLHLGTPHRRARFRDGTAGWVAP
ncbi:MAG: pyridoxamine 5'-phosphate oxidase family protein [Paracoccaceae bacterium]|nr:pyridoxamine 5'-phosphate oxidase family protein [Paracoccaceae bacterium]